MTQYSTFVGARDSVRLLLLIVAVSERHRRQRPREGVHGLRGGLLDTLGGAWRGHKRGRVEPSDATGYEFWSLLRNKRLVLDEKIGMNKSFSWDTWNFDLNNQPYNFSR